MIHVSLLALLVLLGQLLLCSPSSAQRAGEYPTRPISVIVPFTPGAPADIAARRIGGALTDLIEQPIVVENRPGAGGSLAANFVAKAAPDGYTLLMGSLSTHVFNIGIYKSLPYDPIRDFQPITRVTSGPFVIVVHPSLGVTSLSGLITLAKQRAKNGSPLTLASGGVGSAAHLAGELFKQSANIEMPHVPYRGSSAVLPDLLAGRIDVVFAPVVVALPFVTSDKLTGLAITTPERSSLLPQVPSVAEIGFKDLEISVWVGLFAPAGTPKPIVDLLSKAVLQAVRKPDVSDAFEKEGNPVETDDTPGSFSAVIKQDTAKWLPIIKASGTTIE